MRQDVGGKYKRHQVMVMKGDLRRKTDLVSYKSW
jgi:hypothetical protein